MRLDKYLSQAGVGSRKDVKKLIKRGLVYVNGVCQKDFSSHVLLTDNIVCDGKLIEYKEFVYIMLNKPSGYISSTYDNDNKTVLDLIDGYDNYDLFPVGRLDKDTEGLLILTNDGKLAHRVLAPKSHVDKRYVVGFEGFLSDDDINNIQEGIQLDDGYICKPAKIFLKNSDKWICSKYANIDYQEVEIVITEGKYHQVKRMFQATGHRVIYLKRVAMGGLELDEKLDLGEYRELSEREITLLQKKSL